MREDKQVGGELGLLGVPRDSSSFMDHSLAVVNELAKLSEALSLTLQGHTRWMGHGGEL